MSISIYYSVVRHQVLSEVEWTQIREVIATYSVKNHVDKFDWEDFCIYDQANNSTGVVMVGAIKLPNKSEAEFWKAVQHWCKAFSELRSVVPGAEWNVHVDDHRIFWNGALKEFDPTK